MNPTLYDILGVSQDASRDEIRKAWREAADRFEPGEGGSTKQFRLFNQAAEVLLDPERRKEYDAKLSGGDAADGSAPAQAARAEAPEASAAGTAGEGPAEEPSGEKPAGNKPADLSKPGKPAKPVTDVSKPDDLPVGAERSQSAGEAPATAVPGPPVPGAARAMAAPTETVMVPPAGAGATAVATVEPDATGAAEPVEEEDDASEDRPARAGWRVPWPVLAVLAVLTALAVGVSAYFFVQEQRAADYQAALDRAPAAAESAAAAVLSYDYKSLGADRDAAAKFLTDKYRSQYVDTFNKLVEPHATKLKATVDAQVLASSAMVTGENRNPDRIPVLLFVNQTTTDAATTGQPSVALNRVRFDMVNVNGTWLVDGITSY